MVMIVMMMVMKNKNKNKNKNKIYEVSHINKRYNLSHTQVAYFEVTIKRLKADNVIGVGIVDQRTKVSIIPFCSFLVILSDSDANWLRS